VPDSLTLLVLGDIHYASHVDSTEDAAERRHTLGLEFVQRALNEGLRLCKPDAIVLLGDVLADGSQSAAEQDLAAVAGMLRKACPNIIAVPGNHDGDPRRFLRVFQDKPGLHALKGYALYSFADSYAADETMTRRGEDTRDFLNSRPTGPLIVIQHSPIYPDVDSSEYPFMPLNRGEIMASYREKGVVLSLSGHYHQGQPPTRKDGTLYVTSPAIEDDPYQFCIVRIAGEDIQVEYHRLKHAEFSEWTDGHIHTPFGYCAVDVHPTPVRERFELLGIRRAVLVEHAPQLYLSDTQFWNAEHIEKPDAIRNARRNGTCRLDAYRSTMREFADTMFRVGLEAELNRDGELTLLEEDRKGWDRVLGAVHWVPSNLPFSTPAQQEKSFMILVEGLAAGGIDVLAHPFRYFHHKKLARPTGLYRPVAKLLRERSIAAELNFHYNQPDPEFFRVCLEEGVRIVVGSDAHELCEAGDLGPHLRLLKEIGGLPLS
jgi:histidinol phosphatase-like PHP family hydrolase